jgi:DNA-binding transcriptional LysR family regulator
MSTSQQRDDRIMQRLKLRDVRVLMAVAECRSMGKAAVQLAVSQPAISKAIAGMERTLGVPLLDRDSQGVEPTIYGSALLKWANVFFDDLRQGVREIEFLADPTAGEVRVGTAEAMAAGVVPAVIYQLSRKFPRLSFNVTQSQTVALQYHDLRERTVDLVLGRIAGPVADEDLNVEILFEDPFLVVAGMKSKWLSRRRIEPVELINEAWCIPANDGFVRSHLTAAFRARGLDIPKYTVGSNSIQLYNAMLATGHFLAVLPSSTLRLSGKRLGVKALSVDLSIPPGLVGIVTLKSRALSPVVQLFIEHARKVAKPLAKHRR